jgi:flagella basal body P-ring formation protein FlgA
MKKVLGNLNLGATQVGKLLFLFLCWPAVCAFEVAPQVDLPIQLKLRPVLFTDRREVALAEVAECIDFIGRCEEASGVILALAPDPGVTMELSQSQVADAVQEEWSKVKVTVSGSEFVKITSGFSQIDVQEVKKATEESVLKLDDGYSRFKVMYVTLLSPPKVRQGAHHIKVDFPPSLLSQFQTNYNLVGEYVTESNEHFSFKVLVQLQPEYKALIATRDISTGDIIGSADVGEMWISGHQNKNEIKRREQIIGRQLRNRVTKGQVFASHSIQDPIVVKRGTLVELLIENGGVNVSTKAEAQADGTIGQKIMVRSATSKKEVLATVVGDSTVKVVM